jgi:hypothetical protein
VIAAGVTDFMFAVHVGSVAGLVVVGGFGEFAPLAVQPLPLRFSAAPAHFHWKFVVVFVPATLQSTETCQ